MQPELIPTRRSLLSRLRDWRDHESWKDFFETYWRIIYQTALKSGLSHTEAEEVVQETIISVSKKLPGFRYDPEKGSFKNWLLRLTRWRIVDQVRKRSTGGRQRHQEIGASILDDVADPHGTEFERLWNQEWERDILGSALDTLRQKADPKHFQIFDLCVNQKWPLEKVCGTLGVSRPHVYLVKHRLSRLLRKIVMVEAAARENSESHLRRGKPR